MDLLRAVAVLFVLFSHLAAAFGYYEIGSLGRFGVILFFVHTSYVLMASLDRSRGNAASFAIRRMFRIYPLAAFCILAVPLFHIPIGPGVAYYWMGAKPFLANLLLTQNLFYAPSVLGPLWSLPLEVQMYCLLPALYFLIKRNGRWAMVLWVGSFILAITIPRLSGRANMLSYAPCFASGILGYAIAEMNPKHRFPAWLWPVAIAAATLLFHPFDDRPLMATTLPLAWLLSLGLGLAIGCTRELATPAVHRITHLIARYSYGIYLTHIVVFWFALDVMRGSPLSIRILVMLAGVLGSPVLLFHTIEDPLIRVGSLLSEKWTQRSPKAVPALATVLLPLSKAASR